ncbi:MAG: ATP phosphoribosyltransferase [Chloroflexota bacterium]|jgi:ATP phosphoribosyltransferase
MERSDIRLALPSKGILQEGAMAFLEACGLKIFRPNPRQYAATIPAMPDVTVLFQRPGDIVMGVRSGSLEFGITGLDVLAEKTVAGSENGNDVSAVLVIHDALGFGPCSLKLAVPEAAPVQSVGELARWAQVRGHPLRVATKFPHLTRQFLQYSNVGPYKLVQIEGTLEIAPAMGNADLICDLVSSGITLRDNHLRPLKDGVILHSQAVLIGNRRALRERPEVLAAARYLLEYIEGHMRGSGSYLITANIRGESAEAIAGCMFEQATIGGLQGPTIAPVVVRDHLRSDTNWYAINIVVRRDKLFEAVNELRAIGGSGVVVVPCAYIFDEEPARYQAMLSALQFESPVISRENPLDSLTEVNVR